MDDSVPIRFSGYAGMDIGRCDNGGINLSNSYNKTRPLVVHRHREKKVVFDISPHLKTRKANVHAFRAARSGSSTPCRNDLSEREIMTMDDEATDILIGGYLSAEASGTRATKACAG